MKDRHNVSEFGGEAGSEGEQRRLVSDVIRGGR